VRERTAADQKRFGQTVKAETEERGSRARKTKKAPTRAVKRRAARP